MTLTADTAARASSEGNPCPPWCVTDHAEYEFHGSEQITVRAADYSTHRARCIRFVDGDEVQVAGSGIIYVRPGDVPDLADFIEGLAGTTPEDLRKIAAAIRRAAAVITEKPAG